ncbi:MAG: alpha/beta hydrolase [Actinomycetota bacterium]|nr:alpha/beta hydrolase [Actinomycetota bacterium]
MSGSVRPAVEYEVVGARGVRVRMRVEGTGEPLLLLNGLARPLESWQPFANALTGRTLVSFDTPGSGRSRTPLLPLSIPGLARVAVSVIDAAGLGAVDVLGFSYGGVVAQQLAVHAPTRVRRLILVSTSCGVGATPGSQDALRALRPPSGASSWPRSDAVGTLWHSMAVSSWSSIPFLGVIRAPVLVVSGARDRVVPPANSALLARRIPGAELVLLPAGHDLQRAGAASVLARAVEPFLATADAQPALPVAG